jgi:hypothetical protein
MSDYQDRNRFRNWLAAVAYKDWAFHVAADGEGSYLQVKFTAPDNVTGGETSWSGRKWRLSQHMTRSEVVQTALKAVLTAEEHEAREQFLYRGRAIFGPHINVERLWELTGDPAAQETRA